MQQILFSFRWIVFVVYILFYFITIFNRFFIDAVFSTEFCLAFATQPLRFTCCQINMKSCRSTNMKSCKQSAVISTLPVLSGRVPLFSFLHCGHAIHTELCHSKLSFIYFFNFILHVFACVCVWVSMWFLIYRHKLSSSSRCGNQITYYIIIFIFCVLLCAEHWERVTRNGATNKRSRFRANLKSIWDFYF